MNPPEKWTVIFRSAFEYCLNELQTHSYFSPSIENTEDSNLSDSPPTISDCVREKSEIIPKVNKGLPILLKFDESLPNCLSTP